MCDFQAGSGQNVSTGFYSICSMTVPEQNMLTLLNNNPDYDIAQLLNDHLHNDDDSDTFTNINITSEYFDIPLLASKYNAQPQYPKPAKQISWTK